MTGSIKAALCAAVAFCASPAYAADFVRYTITTAGTGTAITGREFNSLKTVNLIGYTFDFVVPYNAVQSTPTGQSVGFPTLYKQDLGYRGGSGVAAVGGTDLSFRQFEQFYGNTGFGLSINACLTASASVFPVGNVGVAADCGAVSFTDRGNGYQTDFSGVVTSIVGVEGSGFGSGVVSAVAMVPETSTWTMMLVGFGLVGGAARYRRKSTTIRYA